MTYLEIAQETEGRQGLHATVGDVSHESTYSFSVDTSNDNHCWSAGMADTFLCLIPTSGLNIQQ